MLHHLLSATLLLTLALLSSALLGTQNKVVLVHVRIEGSEQTIYEGKVLTRGHNLTATSGESHHCDGTNNKTYSDPVPTFNTALDDAAKRNGISYTADFYPSLDDFFITSIAGEVGSRTQFWGQYLNFNENQLGGCHIRVKSGDNVLIAFVNVTLPGTKTPLLKLTGPHFAHSRKTVILTVTDGQDGSAVAGADVNGQKTNTEGQVSFTFKTSGWIRVKAEKSGSVRSNQHDILIF